MSYIHSAQPPHDLGNVLYAPRKRIKFDASYPQQALPAVSKSVASLSFTEAGWLNGGECGRLHQGESNEVVEEPPLRQNPQQQLLELSPVLNTNGWWKYLKFVLMQGLLIIPIINSRYKQRHFYSLAVYPTLALADLCTSQISQLHYQRCSRPHNTRNRTTNNNCPQWQPGSLAVSRF